MWHERINDPQQAEKIANNTYSSLFIEKGTIIHASRDFKIPSLREIMQLNQIENSDRYISLDPKVGGWTKFAKKYITPQKRNKKNLKPTDQKHINKKYSPQKKSRRGWIHK